MRKALAPRVFFALSLLSLSAPVSAASITLQPGPLNGKDTMLLGTTGFTGLNLGNDTRVMANFFSGPTQLRTIGLIEFDLSGIPVGATVNSATLSLFHEINTQTNARYDLFRVLTAWNELTVSFNTQPTIDSTAVSSLTFSGAPGVFRNWDVTSVVQGWASGSFANHGMWMEEVPMLGTASAFFASSDFATAAQRPILTVDFDVAVPEPASLVLLGTGVAALVARSRRRRVR